MGPTSDLGYRHLFSGRLHIQEAAHDLARVEVVPLADPNALVCYSIIRSVIAALMVGDVGAKRKRRCRWRSVLSHPGDDGHVLNDGLPAGALSFGIVYSKRLA